MDAELPTSPLLVRLLAEGPWTLAMPLIVLAAALAWWGSRRDQARPILVAVGRLLAAAASLGGAALWTSPPSARASTATPRCTTEAQRPPGTTSTD
ncbi:MAG: hypothetical protein ACKOJI_11660 [Phycisphaerales bacterium]